MPNNKKIEQINKKIAKLWDAEVKANPSKSLLLVPQFFYPEHARENALLYVGMNPSFSKTNFLWSRKNYEGSDKEIRNLLGSWSKLKAFYTWRKEKITNDYLDKLWEIDKIYFDKYSFFAKPKKISVDCKLNFSATDLFFRRETSQKEVKKDIFANRKNGKLTKFAEKQVKIFFEVVQSLKPSVILVGNALGSDIIKVYFKDRLEWDGRLGTHLFMVGGKRIPIFFSGMLSGQRALDNHSFERLEWHIRHALKSI